MRNFIGILLLLSGILLLLSLLFLQPVEINVDWSCLQNYHKTYVKDHSEQKIEKKNSSDRQKQQETNKGKDMDMKRYIEWGGGIFIMLSGVCTVILVCKKRRKSRKSLAFEDKTVESNEEIAVCDKRSPSETTDVISSANLGSDVSSTISDSKCSCFCMDGDNHLVIGASVRGKGHLQTELPCQDNHKYTYLGKGWGIAVVSDGAGSATKSQIGSKIVVERATIHFINVIKSMKWMECDLLPSNEDWSQIAYSVLRRVYGDIVVFAQKKEFEVKDLNATAIVLIHSPFGLLSTHIGDGRAGYRNSDGEWCSVIVPHKGEEANQTIFITSQFWDVPSFRLSGHLIPESRVVREKVTGFTLMSDGCESTSWEVSRMNGNTGKVCDPNRPFQKFYDDVTRTLVQYHQENVDVTERAESWYSFLDSGNAFRSESDDKTLIIGLIQ